MARKYLLPSVVSCQRDKNKASVDIPSQFSRRSAMTHHTKERSIHGTIIMETPPMIRWAKRSHKLNRRIARAGLESKDWEWLMNWS